MEIILAISLCSTTLLAFFFLKLLLKRTVTTNDNLPPSPWRLPVFGNLHQLSLHPHRSLYSLSLRYGPLMLLRFGSVPVVVVSSADLAHDVLKTNDLKVANRPRLNVVEKFLNGGRDVSFAPYGEYWRQAKSVCVVHLLNKKMVRSFERIREEEINLVMGKLEKASSCSSPVNLSELITALTNDVICRAFSESFGKFPLGEYIPCLAWIDRFRHLNDDMEDANKKLGGLLERVVQEHVDEDNSSSDFVDILLSVQRDKALGLEFDRSDLKLILTDMFIAGSTTNSSLLEWAMTALMRSPKCMKKLQDEIRSVSSGNVYVKTEEVEKMKYLHAVIKEVLRLHPSIPLIPRLLSEDVRIKGFDIKAGTQVIINVWAIQLEIGTWGPDAKEFRPERHFDSALDVYGQDFGFIPFGSGRRICPGIGYALAFTKATLANLINRFDWLGKEMPDLAEATGLDVCRKFPLIAFPSSVL